MTLPLRRSGAGGAGGWRYAAAALVVALALGAVSRPSRAEDADPYTATVTVDATADTVIKAREMARLDGQRRALTAVIERLTGGHPPAKVAKLDDNAITGMVASFEVAHERMSAVRYVAECTYHFQAAAIQRLVGNAGIAVPADSGKTAIGTAVPAEAGKTAIVLPVYQSGTAPILWDDPNPWRDAWEKQPAITGPVHVVVPLGDAGDVAAIDADKAEAGDAAALAAITQRNGADEAIVVSAAPRGATGEPAELDVTVRRYRGGQLVNSHVEPVTANPGENAGDMLRRAAATIAAGIENGWKKAAPNGYDQQGVLTAVLPITGLDDWVRAHHLLAGVPAVRKVSLMALSRQEATIEIGYVGTIDQLKTSLAGISLDLMPGDPVWRLAPTGSDRVP